MSENLPPPWSSRAARWLLPLCLAGAILLAYSNSLRAPFLFDDADAVLRNPTIHRLWSLDAFSPPANGGTTTGRPLVNFSFALNYALSGENPWSYHAFNLALHVLAALTFFGLLRRTLGRSLLAGEMNVAVSSSPASRLLPSATLPFAIALLWALHPLLTETVVNAAQRTELLCGLFYLFTLYAFARGLESPRWLALSVGACLCGMATKEVMVTAPFAVLLYDRTFVARSFAGALRARSRYYAALAATWLLLAGLLVRGGGARGVSAGFGLGVSPWDYLLTQAGALVRYLRLALWPHPLVFDYGTAVARSLGEVWRPGLLVLALLAGTIWALVCRPRLGFVAALFFLILAPSSSFVPLVTQTIAEHRMYLPLAAVLVLLALAAHRWLGSRTMPALLGLAVTCAGVTFARNRDYRDELALWSDTVTNFPSSARAQNNLALALDRAGRPAEANDHFARAVTLDPNYVAARYNWALALLDQRRPRDAVTQFEAAIQIAEVTAPATGARVNPSDLADAHYQLAQLAAQANDAGTAQLHFEATLRLAPDHAGAHAALGLLLAQTEHFTAAAEHFRAVLRLRPDDIDAHANLGNVLLLQGDPRAAMGEYETVLRLRPDDARARENLQLARDALR